MTLIVGITQKQIETIHHLFEMAAQNTPESPAVMTDRDTISYAELNAKANQLARFLQIQGVGRGQIVAIHLVRSIELIIAVLAVLKTGAAYVPLPSDLPRERILGILDDTAAPVVIADATYATWLAASCAQLVDIHGAWHEGMAIGNLALDVTAQDISFCIYTSGSTGAPKGVLVPNSGIGALMHAQRKWFAVTAQDRVLQFASFGFDAFVFDLVMAFGASATLILRGEELGDSLVTQMQAQGVTIATLPPAWLTRTSLVRVRSLRCVISAGEACQLEHLKALPPGCDFINAYGPTETTIWASSHRVTTQIAPCAAIPIGVPVAQTQIFILDENCDPVTPGMVGEIHLAGIGLAHGYLKRADLSAEKFIPNPFGAPGGRMYRTGDLGRYLADGSIEFWGRIDHQVKIRGFRIELGEIETKLMQFDAVREVVVVGLEQGNTEKRLVAYVVAKLGMKLTINTLRSHLQQSLPDYMIPAAWVFLDGLPLNASGKVDRKALPAPQTSRSDIGVEFTAPQSDTEHLLAQIWADVLQLDQIGAHDGFRSLGGSSMQAVEVGFRVSCALTPRSRPPQPFGNVTVAEYAGILDRHMQNEQAMLLDASGCLPDSSCALASYAQEQVYFLEQLGEAWRAYRCHASIRLIGDLNLTHLQTALNGLIARHEILRTGFIQGGTRLQRVVVPEIKIDLICADFSMLPSQQRERALALHLENELAHRFDIASAPLIRWSLCKLSATEHILLQSEHHNIHDGLSFRIILRDMAELYAAACNGRAAKLPQIEAQYGDFCAAEMKWMNSADFSSQLEQWAARLSNFTEVPRLFVERQNQAQQSFIGRQLRHSIALPLFDRINQTAATLGVSRYALMLAAFGILCSRHSSQKQFLIGSALANRTALEYQSTVGMFVNMVPIPFAADEMQSFANLAKRVGADTDFALTHSAVPLGEIVKHLGLSQRLQGGTPFNVGFSFHDSMKAEPAFHDLQLDVKEALSNGSAKFDLSVVGVLGNQSSANPMELLFEFNTDLFDNANVERMVQHYLNLLHAITAAPQARLTDLQMLNANERQKLLVEWNNTDVAYAHEKCLHELFQLQVANQPETVAVTFEGMDCSYAQLNAKANQLAYLLRASGVVADSLVAICMERGLTLIVGLLAIMKAGAAYVFLDPDYPQERLAFMLNDTSAAVLLTQQHLLERLPVERTETILIDHDWSQIAQFPEDNLHVGNTPDNVLYCIYTSGSTGRPKGVLVTGRSVLNLIHDWSTQFPVRDNERFSLWTSFGFDVSIWEWMLPLTQGATIVIPDDETRLDAEKFMRWAHDNAISTAYLPPHIARMMPELVPKLAGLPSRILLGVEPLNEQAMHASLASASLINAYGPTEATVYAIAYKNGLQDLGRTIPIGRPIANTQIYLIDQQMELVPEGAAGEVCIAGHGLAQAYLHRPELTAEKFVPNPFGVQGRRMYRTGDLARYLPDGNLQFLGRLDAQVKIRGFRIELGEIESCLLGCEVVRDAVVLVRQGAADQEKQLVGYVVAVQGLEQQLTVNLLRAHLQKSLPNYMVPTAWVLLPALPLTANGKVDRHALLASASSEAQAMPVVAEASATASSASLATVLQVLHDLIPGANIGPDDDIFAKGLHSIMMTRFVAQCRELLGVMFKIRDVYKLTTPNQISRFIDEKGAAK